MTDPMTTLRAYVDAFNRGDVESMAAAFAPSASILDGLAPHAWHGPSAVREWYRDVMAASRREGATDYAVTLDEPRHVDVTDDSAYLVVPATMAFALNGARLTQTGSTLTAALQRTDGQWRIVAWAWSKGPRAHRPSS